MITLKDNCDILMIEDFINAIIIRAVQDYTIALKGKAVYGIPPDDVINECERFFKSEHFKALTDIDGTELMNKIKKVYKVNNKMHKRIKKKTKNR